MGGGTPSLLPRFMNRGLIEAFRPPRAVAGGPGLPRFMNRGLIEAALDNRPFLWPSVLPRFMNRGLIEALTLITIPSRAVRTSPIHESGPH